MRRARFLAPIFVVVLSRALLGAGESIYDQIGLWSEHGLHGAVPEENVDLFTGNLTLTYVDYRLPGPNGHDIAINRTYNSKIVRSYVDPLTGETRWVLRGELRGPAGIGWTMHMGRLLDYEEGIDAVMCPDGSLRVPPPAPTIELPDGKQVKPTLTGQNGTELTYVTRDFMKLVRSSQDGWVLYGLDGTRWHFGLPRQIVYGGTPRKGLVVTKIVSPYGHEISVEYFSNSPCMSRVSDQMGRGIEFVVDEPGAAFPKLQRMDVKDSNGATVSYLYRVKSVDLGTPLGEIYMLESYDPPELPEETFQYHEEKSDLTRFQLKKVTTSFGGTLHYVFGHHRFAHDNPNEPKGATFDSSVLTSKTIDFASGASGTWSYVYPTYESADQTTVTVNGPKFSTKVRYYSVADISNYIDFFHAGLIRERYLSDGSLHEWFEWDSVEVEGKTTCGADYLHFPVKKKITRTTMPQSLSSVEQYFYDRTGPKACGLPTGVQYSSGCGSVDYRYGETIEYAFESQKQSVFPAKYMMSYVSKGKTANGSGAEWTELHTLFNDNGSPSSVTKRGNDAGALTWTYTYDISPSGHNIKVTTDLPGAAGEEVAVYKYGTLQESEKPGFTLFTRTISQYDSSIIDETNQHGGTMTYSYDELGRIEKIDMPPGFYAINADWADRSVTITRGRIEDRKTIVKTWDGLGRSTGYTEAATNEPTLHFEKTLDAEGRVVTESKGSNKPETHTSISISTRVI